MNDMHDHWQPRHCFDLDTFRTLEEEKIPGMFDSVGGGGYGAVVDMGLFGFLTVVLDPTDAYPDGSMGEPGRWIVWACRPGDIETVLRHKDTFTTLGDARDALVEKIDQTTRKTLMDLIGGAS